MFRRSPFRFFWPDQAAFNPGVGSMGTGFCSILNEPFYPGVPLPGLTYLLQLADLAFCESRSWSGFPRHKRVRSKDEIEEVLFGRRRDLFTEVDLVFFDTTSIYFEGEGGESLGERGFNKDHRPDLRQMVVGLAVDIQGRPICCELWPGNTADVTTLKPVVERMRQRFRLREITAVADRGMVSQATLEALSVGFVLMVWC